MSNPEDTTANPQIKTSISTFEAQQLATITKSAPQMQGITSRWLLKILPWVQVRGGAYQVNRVKKIHEIGNGRVEFTKGEKVEVIAATLSELPFLYNFKNHEILKSLADQLEQKEFKSGDDIIQNGKASNQLIIIVHGKVSRIDPGDYDADFDSGLLKDGDSFGYESILGLEPERPSTYKALTNCIVMVLSQERFEELVSRHPTLGEHIEKFKNDLKLKKDDEEKEKYPKHHKHGIGHTKVAAGHEGEALLPTTFVEYEINPRIYPLNAAQTILRVHTRVADLYNDPMNQTEEQLKLTVEALREQQEDEMINNPAFGLLHNVDYDQRLTTRSGPPTPDDLDELITRRRNPQYILAHPRAISAFGRECSRRGIYPQSIDMGGHLVPSWRGIPVLPCTKIPVTEKGTTSILIMRTGEKNQGVIGLNQTGIPDEYEPGLNVRFMGIDDKAVISYLVTLYFSVAVLIPDALGMLEDVEIGR